MISTFVLPFFAVFAVAVLLFLTVAPIRYRPRTRLDVHLERALAFAVATSIVVATFPGREVIIGGICVLSAGMSELLQKLTTTRHARLGDAAAKAAGAAVGAICALLISGVLP